MTHSNGKGNGSVSVADVVGGLDEAGLEELWSFWRGTDRSRRPTSGESIRRRVIEWMCDPSVAADRVGGLGRRLGQVVDQLVQAPRYSLSRAELERAANARAHYDLEACLAALARRAIVVPANGADQNGEHVFALPRELGDGLVRGRREVESGVFDVLSLRGHLDRACSDPSRPAPMSPQRIRELYKMYANETAAVARVERLPEGVRGLVTKAILEFGGVLPRGLFERMETDLPHWNGRRWRLILEQSLVGTVRPLALARYGIQHDDETLVVFNEVALAWLRRVAVPSDPDAPHEELSLGISFASNLSRFLAYIRENDVRITVRGEIFKTTEKKIVQSLIPNPGRELSREAVLAFLYAVSRHLGLIDRTGERTLCVTREGREWDERELGEKLRALVEFSVEERELGGEPFHQKRLRHIFMRLLKRVEPGIWYDLMYLPFLARNTYLANLDELEVEDYFAERTSSARYTPMEDPQRLAWNLVRWVRQRMYLLGVVDLGYDAAGRPVAMRLTHSGARLLGVHENLARPEPTVGNLVVTADFEVVLFPTGDDAELVHDLDRFCSREKMGELFHFRISEDSIRRALHHGMYLERILQTLEGHSRTPVPQNVLYSIRDWARRAGLMTLGPDHVVRCEDAETMRRFQQDAGVRQRVRRILGEHAVELAPHTTPRRLQGWLRDLGFLVELAS